MSFYKSTHELRFWDANFLDRAHTVLNFEQMRGVVDKLHAGRPLTVVAVGDSIVADFGG
jgi:hypothetical protein